MSGQNNNEKDGRLDRSTSLDKLNHQAQQTLGGVTLEPPQLQKQQWTGYLIFCNISIVIGTSFMFGYNLGVVNAPFVVMNNYLNQSFYREGKLLDSADLANQWSLVVSLYLIGGIVGSTWFPGLLAGRLGKRKALIVGSVIGAIGAAVLFITPFTQSYIPLYVGRPIVGFQAGLAMVIAPGLVTEQAPGRLRGACGSLVGMGIAVGVVVANFLGLSFVLGTDSLWHYLFLFVLGIYVFHGFCLFFVCESPRYLIDQKKEDEAQAALRRLRNGTSSQVKAEFLLTKQIAEEESTIEAISVLGMLKDRNLWWPMLVVIQLHIVNQLTGLSAVFFYATQVMSAGFTDDVAALANFGISVITVIGNIVSSFIVDRVGRRPLMLAGTGGIGLANILLVVVLSFNVFEGSIVAFALFLASFAIGPGPIPWFMAAEMFGQAARPTALAIGMFANWVANIIVSFLFPAMNGSIGQFSFLPFAAIAFIEFAFLFCFLPETCSNLVDNPPDRYAKGKSLWQIRQKPKAKTAPPVTVPQQQFLPVVVSPGVVYVQPASTQPQWQPIQQVDQDTRL